MYYKIVDSNKLYICTDMKFDCNRNLLQLITRQGICRVYNCSPTQYESIHNQIIMKGYGDISMLDLNEKLTQSAHNMILECN